MRKILFALAIFLIAFAAYATPAKPNNITFNQNTSEHYANGAFSVNWSANTSNGNISNYTIYIFNGSTLVLNTTNTSETGYLFSSIANNGNYTFNVTAANETGESENSTSTWIFVDMQNATITLNSPTNGLNTTNTSVTFNFTAADNTALNCSLYINGIRNQTNSTIANNTETTFGTALSEGRHLWNISCTDLANNTNTSITYNIGIDTSAPAITLGSPANGAWDSDGITNFTFTATDAIKIDNCSLWTNTNGTWALNATNGTIANNTPTTFAFGTNVLAAGNYTWNVECFDNLTNGGFANNYTFTVGNATDFTVTDVRLINSSNGNNPIAGSNLTINATIANTGTLNSSNNITIAFFFETTYISNYTISNDTLTANNNVNITFNISGGNLTGQGAHNLKVSADYGNLIAEVNETNNNYTFVLLTGLNVSANITTRAPKPGDNVTINFTIKYQNGSAVTALNQTNFTVFDVYTYGNGTNTSSRTATISYFNNSQNANGIYFLNISAPAKASNNRAEYGNHFIRASVRDNKSIEYFGEDNRTLNNYSMQAPDLIISFNETSYDIDRINGATTRIIGIKLRNNGTINISNVNISISTNSSSLTLAYNSTHVRGIACNYTATVPAAFETVAGCIIKYNSSTLGTYILTATAGGVDTDNENYNASAITQAVTVLNSSNVADDSSSSSSGNDAPVVRIFTYGINITNYSKTVLIEQGSSAILTFAIKHLGNGTINNLSVNLSNPGWEKWFTSTKIKTVVPRELVYVKTNISIPANASVATYTITANASGSEKNSSKIITFKLHVLPGNDTKQQMNITFADISAQINELNNAIIKLGDTNNTNITIASKKLAEVKRLMLEAETAILKEDYLTAYNNKKDIETLLPEIRQLLTAETSVFEKKETQERNLTIIVVFIVSAAGLLYYMWLPAEGYTPGRGYFKKHPTPYLERVKDGITTAIQKSAKSPSDTVHEMMNKDSKYIKPKEQPYSYVHKGQPFSINRLYQNLINQFREQPKGKPAYNFHKKQRWSDD